MEDIFKEGITETIVTTLSADGLPNAAPMGVVKRGREIFIRMYPGTKTYRNVEETGYLMVNIVTDPIVFVISAFQDINCSFFEPWQEMPPVIKDSYAWVFCNATIRGAVRLDPVKSRIVKTSVPSFSRGFAAVIDATITGSRLHILKDEGLRRIHDDDVIVAKCGTPRDIEAINTLKKILGL